MINNKQLIKKYYDSRCVCQVLGALIRNPVLIKNRDYYLEQDDFIKPLHQAIFTTIYNLAYQGVKEIRIAEIETYLANNDLVSHKKIFDDEKNLEWLNKLIEDASQVNFQYYYDTIKKLSLLRSYLSNGIDIRDILDMEEIDPKMIKMQREEFDKSTIQDITDIIDKKNLEAKRRFTIKTKSESRKAGDNAKELREHMKITPPYGFTFESKYLNTLTRGMLGGKFLLETRDTGMGKTRIAIKRLLNITVPYMWSHNENKFVKNSNGGNSGLYIGTEMDLYGEIEPMMWAFVSGIEEDKIKKGDLTEDEDARIEKAIEILQDTKLFLEDRPDFDVTYLAQTIEEYKINHNICTVAIDYIELTPSLISEYMLMSRGMNSREDQVLLNLSKSIKDIAKKFDVFINAFTQTTDEARRDHVRDQRAVKGARSLPNKVDTGIVTFEPDKKEIEKIEPIIRTIKGLTHYPNVCYSLYKNRGGKLKLVKIWGYQNLGTMQFEDLFCTNWDYERINIDKTNIEIIDGNSVTSSC